MENPRLLYYLDDDTDDLHFFKEVAEALGHEVEIFVNGKVLLQTLKKGRLPDLIFLDIRMPVFDGEQILGILKDDERCKHIPVVLISGAYSKSSVRQYLDAGAGYIMKKADSLEDLKSSLQYVLGIDWGNFRAYA
jgi:CheY-like chemotaxis protein